MTYKEARQFIEQHDDPFFNSHRIIAFHKAPCDDGTEEALYMHKLYTGGIDMWYVHSCGYQRWLRDISAIKLPNEGWQLLQIACNRVISDAIFPDKSPYDEPLCPRHRSLITSEDFTADDIR